MLDVGVAVEVAVNIGASQFNTLGFVDLVERALVKCSVPPHLLELEITESALLQDVNSANRTIAALQTLGVSIALDDFGTGYSSPSYLNNFSFDVLKIDRAFTKNICSNAQSLNILIS